MRAAPMAYNFYLYELENSNNEFWLGFFVFHGENCKKRNLTQVMIHLVKLEEKSNIFIKRSILQMSEIHFHSFCIFFVAKTGHLHIFGSS